MRVSLAGRTESIREQGAPLRVGGFGGVAGLARYLSEQAIDVLIDATHPFAAVISEHAAQAAREAGVSLLALRRPAWSPEPGDRWIEVEDVDAAVEALGASPRRVFLALGRKEVHVFGRAPQHFYLVRSVDPVDPPLPVPHAHYVVERGPFTLAADRKLLELHGIDRVVSRNSGGHAAYSKIEAARALGIPVLMLRRPRPTEVPTVAGIDGVLEWLSDHASASGSNGTLRGV